jgi:hypothetical protein
MESNFNTICSYICNPLLYTGFLLLLISNISKKLYGIIVGYAFILTGLVGFIILFLGMLKKSISNVVSITPIVILIIIITILINNLTKYYSKIENKQISTSYNSFSNIFISIIFLEIVVMYLGSSSNEFKNSGILPKLNVLLMYFLTILGILTLYNINIIFNYYTTDGFTLIHN